MKDLTIIFYTANYIDDFFMENVKKNLLRCIGDTPLVSVSQKPMNFGKNICVGNIGRSHLNIYRQMMIGAQAADTPYIALAEDDIFYTPEHFQHRPSNMKVFAYDYNRWGLYTWDTPPYFSYIEHLVVNQLISGRDYFVDAMRERFNKYPDENEIDLRKWKDPGRHEDTLGVTIRKIERFDSPDPSIVFSHEDAFGFLYMANKKPHGRNPTDYLKPWGSAEDMMKFYRRRNE